jgi:Uma2 family endonuclease
MSAITSTPPQVGEQRVVLNHVSWKTYQCLLADHIDASSPRFTYDQGVLEIMTLSSRYEELTEAMAAIAELVAEERGVEFVNLGSTTFRRQDLKRVLSRTSVSICKMSNEFAVGEKSTCLWTLHRTSSLRSRSPAPP